MTNNDNTRPVFYATAVRGLRGRNWFAADSASCGDRAVMQDMVDDLATTYPQLRFAVMDRNDIPDFAPAHYRPWDTTDAQPATCIMCSAPVEFSPERGYYTTGDVALPVCPAPEAKHLGHRVSA